MKEDKEFIDVVYASFMNDSSINQVGETRKLAEMPAGLIRKDMTGAGGTTWEIVNERRSSVVVFPTRIAALSKYDKYKESSNLDVYVMVGRSEDDAPNREDEIARLCKAERTKVTKIFCVADSFVTNEVQRVLREVLKGEYYLLIDELDAMIYDSRYRPRLIDTLRTAKQHEPEKTSYLFATQPSEILLASFFPNESRYHFRYKFNSSRKPIINIRYSASPLQELLSMLKNYKGKRTVIAINSVQSILKLFNNLGENHKKRLKVFASAERSTELKFHGLPVGESEELGTWDHPLKIVTSAFFSSVDIPDNGTTQIDMYFLVGDELKEGVTSPEMAAQFFGRVRSGKRHGAKSEVHRTIIRGQIKPPTDADVKILAQFENSLNHAQSLNEGFLELSQVFNQGDNADRQISEQLESYFNVQSRSGWSDDLQLKERILSSEYVLNLDNEVSASQLKTLKSSHEELRMKAFKVYEHIWCNVMKGGDVPFDQRNHELSRLLVLLPTVTSKVDLLRIGLLLEAERMEKVAYALAEMLHVLQSLQPNNASEELEKVGTRLQDDFQQLQQHSRVPSIVLSSPNAKNTMLPVFLKSGARKLDQRHLPIEVHPLIESWLAKTQDYGIDRTLKDMFIMKS